MKLSSKIKLRPIERSTKRLTLKKIYVRLLQFLCLLLFIFLMSTKSFSIFAVIYSLTAVLLNGHMFSKNTLTTKIMFSIIYIILIMSAQHVLNVFFVFSGVQTGILFLFKKFIAIITMFVPFLYCI